MALYAPIGSEPAPQMSSINPTQEDLALAAQTNPGGTYNPTPATPSAPEDTADQDLRFRLGMREAGNIGKQITSADQADGDVGYGTVAGSAISGAASGAVIGTALGGPGIGTAVGGAAGLGAGLLSMYEARKAKRDLAKATKARELQLYRQQKEWLLKNKDRLALEGKVNMAQLNAKFEKEMEDEKILNATRGMTRMDAIAEAMKKNRQPTVEALSEIF